MSTPVFHQANPITDRAALLALNTEYMAWVVDGLKQSTGAAPPVIMRMGLVPYVASVLDKLCAQTPPQGVFYVVMLDGAVAGMGGLRRVGDAADGASAGVAEIKRVYVRPAFRGRQLGRAIVQRLMADARGFGYQRVCLDSAPFMQAAQRLYEALGFVDCAAYEGTEVPVALNASWRFMAREL
jgi:GNAT superfamily N-acetyltransferase